MDGQAAWGRLAVISEQVFGSGGPSPALSGGRGSPVWNSFQVKVLEFPQPHPFQKPEALGQS